MCTYPPSVLQAFLNVCERTPEQPCLLFQGETHTYADLHHTAARWSGAMYTWGLQPGDRVALFLENSPAFLAAYLGIHMAGAIAVLVNIQYRQTELHHILNDAGVRLCITDTPRLPELLAVAPQAPTLEAAVVVANAAQPVVCDAAATPLTIHPATLFTQLSGIGFIPTLPPPEAIALIGYTSGTTGRSKGAMLSHSNLAANSAAVTAAWHWSSADRLLLTLPLFHIHGLGVGIHGTLLTGGSVELQRSFDAAAVYERLCAGDITLFFGVPTMYTRLVAEARCRQEHGETERTPTGMRLYVSGSAPLSIQTFHEFAQLFGQRILERYGMTETVMNLTNPYDGERRPGTVGQPFPGQEARIVDVETRQPILDECVGEIQVRGPHVFKGYWKRPDATAEVLDETGWLSTGDLGWRSSDGYYTISGRAKELIISGGYNIYPREVEEVLLHHPGVAEVTVVGLPDADLGEQVVAVVVPASDPPPDAEELVAFCREQLASYKKPRRIVFVEALPRNALGKVQKHVVRERVGSD